ncbi:MAG: T9SS type A sorting domain-containing protein [bacterium]|nr:T9SS type A sorting domain-containing protein [bacterium]
MRNVYEKEHQKSIKPAKSEGLQLIAYPNPLGKEVNFAYNLEEDFEKGEIVLQNCLGQTIAKKPLNAKKGILSMESPVSSGIYFYQVVLDGVGVKTGKLVKE